jgi:hypothetical protein
VDGSKKCAFSIVAVFDELQCSDQYFEPDEYTRALWHFDEMPGSTTLPIFPAMGII